MTQSFDQSDVKAGRTEIARPRYRFLRSLFSFKGVAPALDRTVLRWAMGCLCVLLGALMLVVPQQFAGPVWRGVAPWLPAVASAYLAAGGALFYAAVHPGRRTLDALAHFAAAAVLSMPLWNAALVGAWPSLPIFVPFVTLLAVAPWIGRDGSRDSAGDYFAAVWGVLCLLLGGLMLLAPSQFEAPIYETLRPRLLLIGAGFILGGLLLLAAQLRSDLPLWFTRLAHLSVLPSGIAYAACVAIPFVAWTGLITWLGLNSLVASLPWTGRRIRAMDPTSLRVRLSLGVALAATLPLIGAMALIGDHIERQTRSDELSQRQTTAVIVAHELAEYVRLHQASVRALAAQPGFAELSPQEHERLLRGYAAAFPDMFAFATYDAAGNGLARSDGRPVTNVIRSSRFDQARDTGQSWIAVDISPTIGRPIVSLGSPVYGPGGTFVGYATGGLELSTVSDVLSKASPSSGLFTFLVDGQGRAIAYSNTEPLGESADLSGLPPVAAFLRSAVEAGSLSYVRNNSEQLAGYAPVTGLDWGVIAQQPASQAFAPLRGGRHTAFGLLLLVGAAAVAAGAWLASRLAGPIVGLARFAEQVGKDRAVPRNVPSSTIREVVVLHNALTEMQAHLEERTAQREEALQQEREARAAVEVTAADLRQSEERYRTIVQTANEGVWLVDADARTLYVNERMAAMLGWRPGQVLGRKVPEFVFPDDLSAANERIASNLKGNFEEYDFRFRHRDGREVPVLASTSPVRDGQGRVIGALGMFTDGTERRRLERLQREFIAMAAHELKTPLTSLLGFAQLLQRGIAPDRAAEAIIHQSHYLARLVNDLLEVSRLETGKVDLDRRPTDLGELARRCVEQTKAMTDRHAVQLECPEQILSGDWDTDRLEQVFQNLLSNAVKYMPDGGVILLRIRDIGSEVEVSICDRGLGIIPDDLPKVFDRFYRVQESGRGAPGLGLGLYITRSVVQAHGGRIWAESDGHGKGSTFIFTLPYQPAPIDAGAVVL